jgi:hypothetical protein
MLWAIEFDQHACFAFAFYTDFTHISVHHASVPWHSAFNVSCMLHVTYNKSHVTFNKSKQTKLVGVACDADTEQF